MKATIVSILLVLVFTLVALVSLINTSFYSSHDGFTHTARTAAYYRTIKDGQFPPRWATNLNGGMGSPIFTYIYPLPYFLGGVFHFVKFSYQDSFRLVMIFSTMFSALFAFWWLRENFGNIPGVVGAIFYVWVPYRFLNLYVRGAFAENLAYTFIPLILLSAQKLISGEKTKMWWSLLSISIAALLLSHNEIAAISLPVCILWTLLWALLTGRWKMLCYGALAFASGFLIAGFIYFPDLFERSLIRFDHGISYYSDYFVQWWQLVKTSWGFGFDLPGTAHDDMSLQIGLANLLVIGLSTIVLLWTRFKNKLALYFLGVWALVVFLMIDEPLIRPIWKAIPLITTIVDFPWRFLGIVSLAVAFLAAFLTSQKRGAKIIAMVLITAAILSNKNYTKTNMSQNLPDPVFDAYKGTSTAASNEYTPIWYSGNFFLEKDSAVSVLNGKASVVVEKNNSKGILFSATSTTSAVLRINRFYFPKTEIFKNNKALVFGKDYTIDDVGLMEMPINPPGGQFELRFENTPIRNLGNILSVLAFLITSTVLLMPLTRIKKWKITKHK